MNPASDPHSLATLAVAASKEGDEAGIAFDDDNAIDVVAEKRLLGQLDLRVLPAFALIFILGALAANLFCAVAAASSLTTMLFQVPSNYMIKYFSPSYWLAFLMFGGGATLKVMAASLNYITVLLLRLFLGSFEAGLVPGVVYFFTLQELYFLRHFLFS
ncbi:hypothetical protein IW261DRAFT_1612775 [Armillaria novae-zelandiae]|uniref:Uncharacterized protein n=1 Tax=Armillaria novae-zelandiae TaxID=153914 RepID=A0AA39NN69_9AGAR|nr:hypothetical protein IW261DRAFT_1612775 [Armillaria novae-zelandiae]